MKILLTNDDGIDAPGLRALLAALPDGWTPIVIAPVGPQSGCSHSATTGRGVQIEQRGENQYAIHGTPVDCVRLGLHTIAPDAQWILVLAVLATVLVGVSLLVGLAVAPGAPRARR